MIVIEKGALATAATVAGVVFVGLVGYKIIKKKKPQVFEKAKESLSNIKKRTSQIMGSAQESFRAGYAQA